MKVANIIEDGRLAGPQVRILGVSQVLQTHGVQTTVIHPVVDSQVFGDRLDAAGIAHAAMPLRRMSKGWRQVLLYIVSFPREIALLYHLFRKERFDIVHCSGGAWQVKGAIAGRLAGVRVVWHLNDTAMPPRLRRPFMWLFRLLSDALIVAGSRVKQHYIGGATLGRPIFEIQAPVNCDVFEPESVEPDSAIAAHNGTKIVTIANINPLKGLEVFIAMAAALNTRYENLSFHVVGPLYDSQKAYFAKLLAQRDRQGVANIVFHGGKSDVRGALRAADIYVCSSISEASPISVWEAMAMCKAVVSTDVGDVRHFVEHGVSGLLTKVSDPDELAAAVGQFIDNAQWRRSCGQKAREVAKHRLDLPICARAHLLAYRAMVPRGVVSNRPTEHRCP